MLSFPLWWQDSRLTPCNPRKIIQRKGYSLSLNNQPDWTMTQTYVDPSSHLPSLLPVCFPGSYFVFSVMNVVGKLVTSYVLCKPTILTFQPEGGGHRGRFWFVGNSEHLRSRQVIAPIENGEKNLKISTSLQPVK